jgi:FAD/FMN-containing dehydrogenase
MSFSLSTKLAVAALLIFVSHVWADACDDVESSTDIDVARPLTLSYISEQNEYWSEACSMLKPVCIVFPTTADEVAAVVRILANYDHDFAVKSGGHSPNKYFASVEEGLLISTSKIEHADLDQNTGILKAGPGNRLDGIAKKLDGTGWTFVGGRIGNTGIGKTHQ